MILENLNDTYYVLYKQWKTYYRHSFCSILNYLTTIYILPIDFLLACLCHRSSNFFTCWSFKSLRNYTNIHTFRLILVLVNYFEFSGSGVRSLTIHSRGFLIK